jgi:hypothetical protein
MSSRTLARRGAIGLALIYALGGCHDAETPTLMDASVAPADSGGHGDATVADAASTYTAMVEGVECARFRVKHEPWACNDGSLDEACARVQDLRMGCPWTIGDPRTWWCSDLPGTSRSELVCNTCGGVNVEDRHGLDGEVFSFSFSASGKLIGLITVNFPRSETCMGPVKIMGDPCPAATDLAARAAVSLCPSGALPQQ